MTVTPGENITLECSTDIPAGFHTLWIQLCSNNTSQIITQGFKNETFNFTKNRKTSCYDLVIYNITESEACVYYEMMVHISQTNKLPFNFGKTSITVTFTGKNPLSFHVIS